MFRLYDKSRDRECVHRLLREVGWLIDDKEEAHDDIIGADKAHIAEMNGEAECLVCTAPGTIRHVSADIPLSGVTGVATSRIARRRGLAGRLTAHSIAQSVADGAVVSGLGMFEQGFYNKLGYGTGTYEHRITIEPHRFLLPSDRPRVPVRLTMNDFERIHECRLNRLRLHGACSFTPARLTRFEMAITKNGFGLGYEETPGGPLTHTLWAGARTDVETGPYTVRWLEYQTREQFMELMLLLRDLADQVYAIRITEPPDIQLQDCIQRPIEQRRIARAIDADAFFDTLAYWQMRICKVEECLKLTHLPGTDEVRFNLVLTDPIERMLPDDAPWRGVAGEYVVTIGPECHAERCSDSSLPTMRASVNAFTRLWLGVRPPSGLSTTDDIDAPQQLLEQLDWTMRLPTPHIDWDF